MFSPLKELPAWKGDSCCPGRVQCCKHCSRSDTASGRGSSCHHINQPGEEGMKGTSRWQGNMCRELMGSSGNQVVWSSRNVGCESRRSMRASGPCAPLWGALKTNCRQSVIAVRENSQRDFQGLNLLETSTHPVLMR